MTNVLEIELKSGHSFCACVVCGDWMYYSAWDVNGLYRINIKTRQHEMLGVFVNKDNVNGIHKLAFLVEKKIWFIPTNICSDIAVYDIECGNIEYLPIPVSVHSCDKGIFESYHIVGDNVYLVPGGYDGILKINLGSYDMKCYSNWPVDLKWNDRKIWFNNSVCMNGVIYLCPCFAGCIIAFDLKTESMSVVCECAEDTYKNVVSYNDKIIFFATKWRDNVIEYNPETKEIAHVEYKNMDSVEGTYSTMFVRNNIAWLFPMNGKQILLVDMEKRKIDIIDIKTHNGKLFYVSSIKFEDDYIVHAQYKETPMLLINDEDISVWNIEPAENELDVFLKHVINNKIEITENEKTVGQQIYERLIEA